MHRTSNVIKMLQFLRARGVVKKEEIADHLGVNVRNISEYRKELEQAGYKISSIPGKEGGYTLDQRALLPTIDLTDAEAMAITLVHRQYRQLSQPTMIREFESAMQKILQFRGDQKEFHIVEGVRYKISNQEIEDLFFVIQNAILSKVKLEIDYRTRKDPSTIRVVHPYEVFQYRSMWYVIVRSEASGNIFTLKFNRINKVKILNTRFDEVAPYNLSDYVNEFGPAIEEVRVKLLLTGSAAFYAPEYVYGYHQVITQLPYEEVILEVTLASHLQAKHLVMNFGSQCKVVEPEWLIDEVLEEAKLVQAHYKNRKRKK
jgi:predicted DNA-binding transcriptional regulator YafY